MWTPQILSTQRVDNQIKISVGFIKDTGESVGEDYYFNQPDLTTLKAQIKSRLDTLNAQDAFTVPTGVIDVTPIVTPPTQAQIDRDQFISDYQLWTQVKHGIDMGVLTGNEAQVVALKAKVQSEFKPIYLNLL